MSKGIKRKFFTFVILPVLLASSGEFMLKNTLNDIHANKEVEVISTQPIENKNYIATLGQTIKNSLIEITEHPLLLLAIILIFSGGLLWLVAMSKFELSFLYPFLSINFLIIIVGSQILLKEEVNLYRYLSVVLIISGLIIISRSPYSEKE